MGIIRLFLALVVVTAHFQAQITRPNNLPMMPERFTLGFHSAYAVLFFYVISGFLITYTLTRNYVGRPGGTIAFYKNRIIRIFSLYWPLVIIAFVVMPGAVEAFTGGTLLDKFTGLFLIGADWNLNFGSLPADNWNAVPEGLHPAWTLGAELSFYLIAPLLVRDWRVILGAFLASLILRGLFVAHLGTHIVERWTYYFLPSTLLFFLAGQGICLLAQRFTVLASHRLGCVATAVSMLIMLFTHDQGFDIPRLWWSIGCFTLGLPGFFDFTKRIGWMNALGNLSYPLYLTHQLVVLLIGPPVLYWFRDHGLIGAHRPTLLIVSFLSVAVAVALVAHHLIENPLARAMKATFARARPSTSLATSASGLD